MRVRSMEILTATLIYPYKDRNGNEAENEARFNSKVTVSSCVITSVKTQAYYLILKTPAK